MRHQLKPANRIYRSPVIDHWVLQLHGVEPARISDPQLLESVLNRTVAELRLTRVSGHSHYFGPGVSTVIILSESHLSAHTWPELGYVHVDLVTCVKQLTREALESAFRLAFEPEYVQLDQLEY